MPSILGLEPFAVATMKSFLPVALLAAAVVLPGLGRHDFWLDEIFTLYFSGKEAGEILSLSRSGGESAPPFFYLIVHGVGRFSRSEWALRLPAAAGAVAAAWVLFRATRAFAGTAAAWAAVASLVSSTVWLKHGQEVRMYSLLMALGGALFFLQWKCLRGEATRRDWLLYGICNAGLYALSYLGLLVSCVQLLAAAGSILAAGWERTAWRRGARVAAVAVLSTFPLWPFAGEAFRRVALASPHFNVHPGPWVSFLFLYAKTILFPFPENGMQFHWALVWPVAADAAAGLLALFGLRHLWRLNRPLLLHAACWGAGAWAASVWARQKGWMFEDRILSWLWLVPHFLVGAGFHLLAVREGVGRVARAAAVAVLAVSVLLGLPSLRRIDWEPRQDWEDLLGVLYERLRPGDRVVLTGTAAYPFSYYACGRQRGLPDAEYVLLPGPEPGSSCDLYASKDGRLRILDGWMAACGLPFCGAPYGAAASSSDLFDLISRPGRTWIVRESGNQGLAQWRGPWRDVLDRLAASANDRFRFGRGESVEVFSVARGSESEPANAEDHIENLAIWPGGGWRRRVRASWDGRHDLTLYGIAPEPDYRRWLKGAGAVRRERRTTLEVIVEVDGIEAVRKSVLPASLGVKEGIIFAVPMAVGEHLLELRLSDAAAAVLRSQQRAAPFSRVRLAFAPDIR